MKMNELEKKLISYSDLTEDKVEILVELAESYISEDLNKSYIFYKQAEESSLKHSVSKTLKNKITELKKTIIPLIDKSKLTELFLTVGKDYVYSLHDTALFCFENGLEISNKTDLTAQLYNNLGLIYFQRSDFEEANNNFVKALDCCIEINDKAGISRSHNNLGTILCRHGNYNEGLKHFVSAAKIFEDIGELSSLAFCTNNIGNIYYEQKNLKEALFYYEKTYERFKEIDNKKGLAMSLNNLGSIYNDEGNFEEALKLFIRSLELKKEINDTIGISNSYANIGDVYKSLGRFDKARDFLIKSLNLKKEFDDKSGIALTYNNLSELEYELKNYDEAEKNAHYCLNIANDIGTLILQRFSYEQLYKVKEATEDYKECLKWFKLYKEISDKLCDEENSKQLNELQTKYASERKEKEAEIYRLKNIELAQANTDIQQKNDELNKTSKHLELINKILRHDLSNNLSVLRSCFRIYERRGDKSILAEGAKYVEKSIKLIKKMRSQEKLSKDKNDYVIELSEFMEQFVNHYPQISFRIQESRLFNVNTSLISVVDNLISNAIYHGKATEIYVSLKENEDKCELRVADNGVGIPDEAKKRIFEEGFKYGETGRNGIGLYIVKRCMESIGGSVAVYDNKPNGTEFILTY